MADFSDDADFEMDSAFLAEVDAIEAAIEPPKATPSTPSVPKPPPLVARSASAPKRTGPANTSSTPTIAKAPAFNATRPGFRPGGRSVSAAGPSTGTSNIGNAIRLALASSQNSSLQGGSQPQSIPADKQSSDPVSDLAVNTPARPARQLSVESIPSPSPARERAISVHSSDDYDCYDIPDEAFDEIDEIAESAYGDRRGPPASSATRQMNLFGGVIPQTPGASGSGNGARGFSSSATPNGLRRTSSKTDGLFGRQHHRQRTKSWDYVKAAQRIQNSKKDKAPVRGSDEEDDEELEQFPDFATPEMVPGRKVDDIRADVHPQPTKMKCKPDPKTIGTWIFPLNKDKRDYQFNIIKHSLFDNTLVSLPTGLGKTFIAGSVMLNFYTWFPTGKVVFVAPTKPLVAQQVEACHDSCGIPGRDAIELTGGVQKAQRRRAWEERRVFYMTPQTFVNDLRDGTCDPRDIVLVVIDEAHRATGAYSYVTIVHYLMAHNPHHRILALSATPGKNSESVQAIVDGLHISRIEIRDEHSMDLQKYIFKKHTDIQVVEMNDAINAIKTSLAAVMLPLLKTAQTAGCCNNAEPETMNAYRATVEISNIMARKNSNGMRVLKPLQYLSALARAMGYLLECSVAMCQRCLTDFYASGKSQFQANWKDNPDWKATMSHIENHRLEAASLGLKTPFPPHPKMQKLNDLLREHFGAEDAEGTRVMVFTNFRESVDEIVAHLNTNGPNIRASRFIGQAGGKGGEKGMNQKEQIATINRFKAGEFNVLVATSIGEEGLDIGEIDLIVCYDAQKAPVRMLQRVGRTGRKRDGKVVVLLAEVREEKNWDKAKESYRDVQKAIIDGSTIELFDDAAKLIPEGVQPQCVEKVLDIEPYDRVVHGNLSGKQLRTKSEGSASTKKRKRSEDVNRNVPEGAMMGFVTAASLTVRKKESKKKVSTPRADGLDSDDEAIEAGVFATKKLSSDSESDIPIPKSATKAKARKTTATPKVSKPRSRKISMAADEDTPGSPSLSQPQLAPSPKRARKTKADAASPRRCFSTSRKSNAAEATDTNGDSLRAASPALTLRSSPTAVSPPRPKPFPLATRKPVAPPSSPTGPSLAHHNAADDYAKPEPATTALKRNLSSLLQSDSDVEILNSTPPRAPSPRANSNQVVPSKPSAPSGRLAIEPPVFTSPAPPKLDLPTDSPDRSSPVRARRSVRMAILDSSPLASPSESQGENEPAGPSTPPRRRIIRGKRPSPASDGDTGEKVTTRIKKSKRSILDKHQFLETEAQLSGSEDEDGDFDPEGVENAYDRSFVRDSPLTQAPAGYDQQQYYRQSLMTQVPGGSGLNFTTGPLRYTDYVGRGGAFAGAGLGNRRRPGVSSSPVREGAASQYVRDSFVVDDEEDIEYEESSDKE
ncbi:3'-5' DNA helicase [Ceratobasidium sp. 370]|nr:3'-5' DNA helicase [Ceratobasidium sp. 370]